MSASAAPQKKKPLPPGRLSGQRQQVLVSSSKVLRLLPAAARGALAGSVIVRPRRRRDGAGCRVAANGFLFPAFAARLAFGAPPAAPRRNRKIFPNTADRDMPPSAAAIADAVSPSLHS